MKPSPAFQFYPNDWLSSPRIATMSPAQEGAYIRLLCYDWTNNGIPGDEATLRQLSRLPDGLAIEPVLSCFGNHPRRKGFLTSRRLLDERKKQSEHRKERSESGLKGAKKRWLRHGSAIQQPMANDGSSSSSSSSVQEREKRLHGIPATVAEVIEEGKTMNPVRPEQVCRDFFNHYEGQRRTSPNGEIFWVTGSDTIVTHWKSKLSSFVGNGKIRGKEEKPRDPSAYL